MKALVAFSNIRFFQCITDYEDYEKPIIKEFHRSKRMFYNSLGIFCFARSSRPEVFCKKGVLRNFTKLTGKYLCQILFFTKVAGLGLQLQ